MATNRKQLTSTLVQFYNHPVAKVSIELFLSIGAVMFFAIFAIRPTLLTMSDLIKEIDDKKALNQKMAQKIAALSTVQTEFNLSQPRLPLLEEAIPNQPNIDQVIKVVEKIASDNSIVISSMQLNELPKDEDPTTPFNQKQRLSLPLSITVTGDYLAIKSFVEDLTNSRRLLVVDSIVFTVSDQRSSRRLQATVTANLQYFGKKDVSK